MRERRTHVKARKIQVYTATIKVKMTRKIVEKKERFESWTGVAVEEADASGLGGGCVNGGSPEQTVAQVGEVALWLQKWRAVVGKYIEVGWP